MYIFFFLVLTPFQGRPLLMLPWVLHFGFRLGVIRHTLRAYGSFASDCCRVDAARKRSPSFRSKIPAYEVVTCPLVAGLVRRFFVRERLRFCKNEKHDRPINPNVLWFRLWDRNPIHSLAGQDLLRIETDLKRWSTSYLSTILKVQPLTVTHPKVIENSSEELELPSASRRGVLDTYSWFNRGDTIGSR